METNIGKIPILFLSASPTDAGHLRLDQEFREIQEKLRLANLRDNFVLSVHPASRPGDIIQAILDFNPQIVHFSGHGSESGEICVENEDGTTHLISPDALRDLFKLSSSHVQCVLLNACFSAKQASAISENIEYVIGMKNEISDSAAIAFAIGFYRGIGAGRTIEDSFGFGIVELKMAGISETTTPVFIKKNIKLKAEDQAFEIRKPGDKNRWKTFQQYTYNYLLADQIPESGGWGISQVEVMEEATRNRLSALEKEEGGIISTYLALKALENHENNIFAFRRKEYAQKACHYFLRRRTHKGSFGRYVSSRSGLEIHPSIRHTALAVSALLELDGPPGAIFNGIKYLIDNWEFEDIMDDASPSLAISSIIHAIDKFIATPYYLTILSEEERKEIDFSEWQKVNKEFMRYMVELSTSSKEYPFFEPYGHNKPLIFETALTTIDLLPNPYTKEIALILSNIISAMLDFCVDGALPYNPYEKTPDVGMTTYFLYLISRKGIMECIKDSSLRKRIDDIANPMLNFVLKNYENKEYLKHTHCDTIASSLLINIS
jgi:hypothetical protein